MENKQLHYFVTIAELGSIAGASRILHIAQPALTRQIKNLEEELGVLLFERHARGVTLTQAGKQLYHDAIVILNFTERARFKVKQANKGEIGNLKISITPQYLWADEVQRHLQNFRQQYPDITLNICAMSSRQQLMALRNGELDIGIMFMRPTDNHDLEGKFLYKESMLLAVNAHSPFASTPPKNIRELLSESFVWTANIHDLDIYQMISQELCCYDFSPTVDHSGCDYNSMLSIVSTGKSYTFVPAIIKKLDIPNIVMHELPELNMSFDLEIVWHKNNVNPCLPLFIK